MFRIFFMLVTLTLFSNSSLAYFLSEDIEQYVGIEAQGRHMDFKSGHGENSFTHLIPYGSIYYGLKFNPMFGFEIGHERSISRTYKKSTSVDNPRVRFINERNSVNSTGNFLRLVGFYPFNDNPNINVIGSLGISRTKISYSQDRRLFYIDDTYRLQACSNRENCKKKSIARIGLGLQYKFEGNENFSARSMIEWHNTRKIHQKFEYPKSYISDISPKDSFSYSAGLIYKF